MDLTPAQREAIQHHTRRIESNLDDIRDLLFRYWTECAEGPGTLFSVDDMLAPYLARPDFMALVAQVNVPYDNARMFDVECTTFAQILFASWIDDTKALCALRWKHTTSCHALEAMTYTLLGDTPAERKKAAKLKAETFA